MTETRPAQTNLELSPSAHASYTPLTKHPAMKSFTPSPLPWLLLPLLAAACATVPDPAVSLPSGPYMRVARPDADTLALQIAVRRFTPARGAGPGG